MLLANIAIDPNFGVAGQAPTGGSVLLETLPDGKILAVAQAEGGGAYRITRLNADGTVDRSFRDALADGGLGGMAVKTDSSVIVARMLTDNPSEPRVQLRAVRLSDGAADASFGSGGIATFKPKSVDPRFTLSSFIFASMTATSDGGVLIGMQQFIRRIAAPQDQTRRDVLYKFDAQGNPDATFGSFGGLVPPEVGSNRAAGFPLVTGLPDGGSFLMVNEDMLTRHRADGSIDDSFGDGGEVPLTTVISSPATFPSYQAAHVQPDGKILIPITSNENSATPGYLARLNADGSLDAAFGTNGVADVVTPDPISDLAIDSSGRILAYAGPTLYRLTSGGDPDATFDDDGRVDVQSGDQFAEVAVHPGGVLVAGGSRITRVTERDPIARGNNGLVHVDGTDGNDTITASQAGDNIVISRNGQTRSFEASIVTGLVINTRTGSSDRVEVGIDLDTTVNAYGTGGVFVSTAGGNDRITTANGGDTIQPGAGNDLVDAGGGADTVVGAAGHDTIFGGAGNDSLAGNDGDDKIYGGAGADSIEGGIGNDWLHGEDPRQAVGTGNDTIRGGDGDDWLRGGYDLGDPADVNVLDGGTGTNVLESPNPFGVTRDGDTLRFRGTEGADRIEAWHNGDEHVLSVDGVLSIGAFDIDLEGINHVDFDGAGGNDFMRLNPKLWWAATMNGGTGNDALLGGAAADDLRGGNDDDELAGQGGNDFLDGGFGSDTMQGNAGRDQVDYSARIGNLSIRMDDGRGDGETGENDFIVPDVERILGGSGNDTMIGGAEVNLFYAGDGNDRLVGGGGADRLFGEAGNDRLNGGDGDDYLEAGSGQDTLHGDAGADALFGLGGNDRLFSGGDNTGDTVRGGAGTDLANFDESDDVLGTEVAV